MTTEEILQEEFESMRDDLIAKHNQLKQRSSGKWINSLMIDIKDSALFTSATLRAPHYTEQLIHGRRPGKFPPIREIEAWIRNKSALARMDEEISLRSMAFLIARKIAKLGTKYFQQGGTDLVSAVITDQRMLLIIRRVAENEADILVDGLFKEAQMAYGT